MYLRATLLLVFLVACGGSDMESATPDGDDPDWVALETGALCAPAEVACGPGNCAANVENTCQKPVTCDLYIECICRSMTGEEGPATATSGENTILAGNRQGLAAKVICSQGEVIATIARRVDCY